MAQGQRKLPSGKGLRTGENAYTNQYESDALRKNLQDKAGGWIISPLGEMVFSQYDATGTTLAANRILFLLLPDRSKIVRPTEVRITINVAGAAGALVKTALFFYDTSTFAALTKIPGTEVTFDATVAGQRVAQLLTSSDISPETKLFLGLWNNDTTIVMHGALAGAAAITRPVARLQILNQVAAFAPSYAISVLTKTASYSSVPFAAYLSQTAATLL